MDFQSVPAALREKYPNYLPGSACSNPQGCVRGVWVALCQRYHLPSAGSYTVRSYFPSPSKSAGTAYVSLQPQYSVLVVCVAER